VVFDAWRGGALQRYANLSGAPRRAEAAALAFLRTQARLAKRNGTAPKVRSSAWAQRGQAKRSGATALSAAP
jgi:hypothetical protein